MAAWDREMSTAWQGQELAELRGLGLHRELRRVERVEGTRLVVTSPGSRGRGREVISFASNDYLGLAHHAALQKAAADAIQEWGFGATASRLICGNTAVHEQLDARLARFNGTDAALGFGSGYVTNLATLQALVGRGDLVVCDRLNHASLIDGARLCGARLRTYPHRDAARLDRLLNEAARYKRRLVVTDSVFSVDGDLAPLREIVDVAHGHGATVMVDEAHATGVFGARGRGLAEHLGIHGQIDVHMGTLSKAVGSVGGYVAGQETLVDYLRNRARGFIFTTALPAACCAASIAGIHLIETRPDLRENLWANVRALTRRLRDMGCDTGRSESQIIPVMVGAADRAVAVSHRLYEAGFLVPALRPPTVPAGTSRLRISLSAAHTPADIDALAGALEEALRRARS